jgi:hypothetical protein
LNRILSTFAANNLLKAKDEKEQQKKYSSSINMSRALVSYALQKHIAAQIDTDKADKQASSD